MLTILLTIQVFIACALIGIILVQKNASDGLAGLGGGSSSGDSLFSSRSSASFLTKTTSILATAFMLNALIMATYSSRHLASQTSLADEILQDSENAEENGNVIPSKEEAPSVPIAE